MSYAHWRTSNFPLPSDHGDIQPAEAARACDKFINNSILSNLKPCMREVSLLSAFTVCYQACDILDGEYCWRMKTVGYIGAYGKFSLQYCTSNITPLSVITIRMAAFASITLGHKHIYVNN